MEDIGKVTALINENPYSPDTYGLYLEALQEELIFQYENNVKGNHSILITKLSLLRRYRLLR